VRLAAAWTLGEALRLAAEFVLLLAAWVPGGVLR
jgi:hypothetical protein